MINDGREKGRKGVNQQFLYVNASSARQLLLSMSHLSLISVATHQSCIYQPVCPLFVSVNQSHQQYCSTSVCGYVIMQGKNHHNYHVGCRYRLALANSANNVS